MSVIIPKLVRKFVGFFKGQHDFIAAEVSRRHLSIGAVVREIFDFGIIAYRKNHKLPAVYPHDGLDLITKKK